MLNKVLLIGYAGADSEMKFTAAGIILTQALSSVTCATPSLEAFHLQHVDQELQIRHHSVSRNASSLGEGRHVWGA